LSAGSRPRDGRTSRLPFGSLPPPRSWFEETTPFAGARVTGLPQEGEPFTLERYLFAKRPAAAAE